ncbi:uncharacterized protein LOC126248409 [Schistocerca nitens]|uniref:uncharacterized protein LOC126248409 n=1 Tax=Schistocerca nitens TaxID=7011 RepID=UPI00211864CF|nr:uncharacterized protein LOC126248409 [Schistocerca nitens]
MASAEAVSPELDDENAKNNETTGSTGQSEICEENADNEYEMAELLLEPEVTLNEGESSGNTNVTPSGPVLRESEPVCSEVASEDNLNVSPVPPTATDCENASSNNCAKVLETVPPECDPSEVPGDPSINVLAENECVNKASSESEGSGAVENSDENIITVGAEGSAGRLSDAFNAETETGNINGTDTQGSDSTRDLNVNSVEFFSTDSNFTELTSNSSEPLGVSNTKIPGVVINNGSELFSHKEFKENTNPESGSDVQNEPCVAEEVKKVAKDSDSDIEREKSETKLTNFDAQQNTINVQSRGSENNFSQISDSKEEVTLNSVNVIENSRDSNSEDSTSTNGNNDSSNTLWHKKNVLNSHYYSEHVTRYCTNNVETSGDANVLKSLKPCSVILERLNTNVIDALKNIGNSPSGSFELSIEKSNKRAVVSAVKNEILSFDPADSNRFTSQNASSKLECSGEYIMKENKVKLPPRTPRTTRTKKRKRRRTISSSSSGVQTGSESDRTICNDDNKTATHDKLEISRKDENCSKQEPERKKLKTVEEDSKEVEDSGVNRASSPSDPIAKHGTDNLCNVKEFKDISSVDITSSQDDSSDYPVAPTEDPLTLDSKQMADQENSEDGSRKDNTDIGQIQIPASISLGQSNHTTLPEDVSILNRELRQESQATAVCHTERSDVETNQEGEQSGDFDSHENGVEGGLQLTLGNGNVSNRTKSSFQNGTPACENMDAGGFGSDEMPPDANSFEGSGKENSVTDKNLGDAACIIPDKPRVATFEETPEDQKPDLAFLSVSSNTHVANTRFANVPVRQLQKNNRARKSYTGRDIKQSEQKSGQKSTRPQRQAARKAETQIKVLAEQDSNFTEELEQQVSEEATQICYQCCRIRVCKHQVMVNGVGKKMCSEECVKVFQAKGDKIKKERTPEIAHRQRKCRQCQIAVTGSENNLAWETMDFCQEECLAKFQKDHGGFCCFCKSTVPSGSLGKYCVRFGFDIRQFCRSTCLEEFKKGLKVCSYCQKDISGGSEGFLAPVGDRGQFKEFCSQKCMEKYDYMSGNKKPPPVIHQCAVCNNEKLVTIEVMLNGVYNKLCSEPCFAAFKFVNRIIADQCNVCRKYFDLSNADNYVAYYDEVPRRFCCRTCMNVFILANRRIVPCNWCKVKKYNFDMIKRVTARGVHLLMCSLNCLALYQYSVSATPTKRMLCDMCSVFTRMQYHLAMSDSSVRNFCSYACVMKFQEQYKNSTGETLTASTPIPTGGPKKAGSHKNSTSAPANDLAQKKGTAPVISAVTSLSRSHQNASTGLPIGSDGEAGGYVPTDTVSVASEESSGVSMNLGAQSVTKPQVVTPLSSGSLTSTLAISSRVQAVLNDLATKQPVPISAPVPVSEFIDTEINKIETTKRATSSPQGLPVVLDTFSENLPSGVLPVTAAVGTVTTNSMVPSASAASVALVSNAFIGTSTVDAVLPDSGDGPDVSVDAQKNQPISMVPEKFLAKPSTVGEIFSVETALALATGVPTDSSKKAASQQSSSQSWRVIPEELPENSSPALAGTTSSGAGTTTTGGSGKPVSHMESDATVMRVLVKEVVCIEPEEPPEMKNASVLTKPILHSKGISCRPHLQSRLSQTDLTLTKLPFVPIPVPVPIYVPCPMHMFTSLFPVPMPFPLPIPVPTIIPTTKNTLEELITEIKNIREKLPENPAEAELLTMAEMVANEETEGQPEPGGKDHSDDDVTEIAKGDETAAVPTEESNQVAEKEGEGSEKKQIAEKRTRKSSVTVPEPGEFLAPLPVKSGVRGKPDAHLMLKYTLCLKAWHFWVKDKNKDLEIAAGANYKPRFIKPDILELTAEELNYALCLFVTEAKKPNGIDYPPDVVFYFCLGIQYYLYECGRVDNIFTDPYYIKFTDCLDKIVQSFMAKQMASDEIATRVMEEHLWESKQLGAHSPDVLLTTLMFFNTKYFNLVTVDDHMQLSFAHIMKHWKRPGQASGGTSSALLRFYPPPSMRAEDGRTKTKKRRKYEQQENEENPLRCPVKLYEFYLSKCPDSVKTRSDVFYLQPERSCVPDSPVWYTASPLGKDLLAKMLNRLKIVKEINEAIYCS